MGDTNPTDLHRGNRNKVHMNEIQGRVDGHCKLCAQGGGQNSEPWHSQGLRSRQGSGGGPSGQGLSFPFISLWADPLPMTGKVGHLRPGQRLGPPPPPSGEPPSCAHFFPKEPLVSCVTRTWRVSYMPSPSHHFHPLWVGDRWRYRGRGRRKIREGREGERMEQG